MFRYYFLNPRKMAYTERPNRFSVEHKTAIEYKQFIASTLNFVFIPISKNEKDEI